MRKIRGTSTLKTDMLFLLIAVSYLLLTAVTFDKDDTHVPTAGAVEDDMERLKIAVTSKGMFELAENGVLRKKMDMRNFTREKGKIGVELYPEDDVSWRKVRTAYLYLFRTGTDVILKPSRGGISP